jgi:RND family efflux transporter MFP subunit
MSVVALLAMGGPATAQQQTELPKVTVANPQTMPIADAIVLSGTVTSIQSVNLVARVEGYLEELLFEDGTFVEAGQALFIIEPDQYEEDLKQNLASLRYAEEEYVRQEALLEQNATSVSSVQQALSNRDQALAEVRLAEINLSYTMVAAPFSGRLGQHQVDPGNLVGAAGDPTTIVTLDRLAPIYVEFNVNERDALTIREMRRKAGQAVLPADIGFVPVYAGLTNETGYPHEGSLDFIDTSVDTSTGTIALRAIFENRDFTMFPGLLARIRIPLAAPQPTLVVPNAAVSADQIGNYVLVVNDKNIVERKSVVLGPLDGDMRAIDSGLAATDRVVVDGLVYAKPGVEVDPQVQQTTQSTSDNQ